ncbi:hypothetical protein Tco_1332412, partial [Tanacetum coccineum]
FTFADGNAEFHEFIDFLTRSSIHHALTVSPVVSTTFVEHMSDPSPRPSPSTTIPDSIPESFGGNHGGFRSSQGNSTLEGTDQEAQEASQTCYHTPQSMDEECLIEANIGRKEILKEKL